MGESEPLWVVQWSDDGHYWWIVWDDEVDGRQAPAAYMGLAEAEKRRDEMAAQFEEAAHRVVPFTMNERQEGNGRLECGPICPECGACVVHGEIRHEEDCDRRQE